MEYVFEMLYLSLEMNKLDHLIFFLDGGMCLCYKPFIL
jgi:hypothetical protein